MASNKQGGQSKTNRKSGQSGQKQDKGNQE